MDAEWPKVGTLITPQLFIHAFSKEHREHEELLSVSRSERSAKSRGVYTEGSKLRFKQNLSLFARQAHPFSTIASPLFAELSRGMITQKVSTGEETVLLNTLKSLSFLTLTKDEPRLILRKDVLESPHNFFTSAAFFPQRNDSLVAAASWPNSEISIFDLSKPEKIFAIKSGSQNQSQEIAWVRMSCETNTVLGGSLCGIVELIDLRSNDSFFQWKLPGPILSLDINGPQLFAATSTEIQFCDLRSGSGDSPLTKGQLNIKTQIPLLRLLENEGNIFTLHGRVGGRKISILDQKFEKVGTIQTENHLEDFVVDRRNKEVATLEQQTNGSMKVNYYGLDSVKRDSLQVAEDSYCLAQIDKGDQLVVFGKAAVLAFEGEFIKHEI